MTDRIASDAELEDLTGYEFPSKQLEALIKHGLRPVVRPDGRPRITLAALTAAMIGALPSRTEAAPARPDFSRLRKLG